MFTIEPREEGESVAQDFAAVLVKNVVFVRLAAKNPVMVADQGNRILAMPDRFRLVGPIKKVRC